MSDLLTEGPRRKRRESDCRIDELRHGCDKVRDPSMHFTNDDLIRQREILELELREDKVKTQQKMAWVAMVSMLVTAGILFSPLVSDTRVDALGELMGLFFIAMAGIVGTFMGVTTWISKR